MHEVVGFLEQVESVDEDDGHFARGQVAQLFQQVQDHNIPCNQGAWKCWPLKIFRCCSESLQCTFLHTERQVSCCDSLFNCAHQVHHSPIPLDDSTAELIGLHLSQSCWHESAEAVGVGLKVSGEGSRVPGPHLKPLPSGFPRLLNPPLHIHFGCHCGCLRPSAIQQSCRLPV